MSIYYLFLCDEDNLFHFYISHSFFIFKTDWCARIYVCIPSSTNLIIPNAFLSTSHPNIAHNTNITHWWSEEPKGAIIPTIKSVCSNITTIRLYASHWSFFCIICMLSSIIHHRTFVTATIRKGREIYLKQFEVKPLLSAVQRQQGPFVLHIGYQSQSWWGAIIWRWSLWLFSITSSLILVARTTIPGRNNAALDAASTMAEIICMVLEIPILITQFVAIE